MRSAVRTQRWLTSYHLTYNKHRFYTAPANKEVLFRARQLATGTVISQHADPQRLIDSSRALPPSPSNHSEEFRDAVFLFTPSLTNRLGKADPFLHNLLYKLFWKQGIDRLHLRTFIAVVDSIPDIRPKSFQSNFVDYHGYSYRVEYGGRQTSLHTTYGRPDAGPKNSYLDFIVPHDTLKSGKHGEYSVQVPTTNTMFLNGQHSTMFSSEWYLDHGKLTSLPESTKVVENLRIPLCLDDRKLPTHFSISSPLIPITYPRRVEASFGNVIKGLSEPQDNLSPFPASKELTEGIHGLLEHIHTNKFGSNDPLDVYAVILPPSSYTRLVLKSNNLFLTQQPQWPQAEWLSRSWESITDLKSARNPYNIQDLLLEGATVHRVVGGGGEWGTRAGLITLDPISATASSSSMVEEDPNQLDSPINFNLQSVAPIGSYIQFVAAIPTESGSKRSHHSQSIMRSIPSNYPPKKWSINLSACLGRIRDKVTSTEANFIPRNITTKSSEESLQKELEAVFHNTYLFGAFSTQPVVLKIQTQDIMGREKSSTAVLDVPNTFIKFIQFSNRKSRIGLKESSMDTNASFSASTIMDTGEEAILDPAGQQVGKVYNTQSPPDFVGHAHQTSTMMSSSNGEIRVNGRIKKGFGQLFRPDLAKEDAAQLGNSDFVKWDDPTSQKTEAGDVHTKHLRHGSTKPSSKERPQFYLKASPASRPKESVLRRIATSKNYDKSAETPAYPELYRLRKNLALPNISKVAFGSSFQMIGHDSRITKGKRSYSTFANVLLAEKFDNADHESGNTQNKPQRSDIANPQIPLQPGKGSAFQLQQMPSQESDSKVRISLVSVPYSQKHRRIIRYIQVPTNHFKDNQFNKMPLSDKLLTSTLNTSDSDNPRLVLHERIMVISQRKRRSLIRKQNHSYFPPGRIQLRMLKYSSQLPEPKENRFSLQFASVSSNKHKTEESMDTKDIDHSMKQRARVRESNAVGSLNRRKRVLRHRFSASRGKYSANQKEVNKSGNQPMVRYYRSPMSTDRSSTRKARIEKYYSPERRQSSNGPSLAEVKQILRRLSRRYSGKLVRGLLPSLGTQHSLRTIADRQLALRIGRAVPSTLIGRRNESIRMLLAGLKEVEGKQLGTISLSEDTPLSSSRDGVLSHEFSDNKFQRPPSLNINFSEEQIHEDSTTIAMVNNSDDHQLLMQATSGGKSRHSRKLGTLSRRMSRPTPDSDTGAKLFLRSMSSATNSQMGDRLQTQKVESNEFNIGSHETKESDTNKKEMQQTQFPFEAGNNSRKKKFKIRKKRQKTLKKRIVTRGVTSMKGGSFQGPRGVKMQEKWSQGDLIKYVHINFVHILPRYVFTKKHLKKRDIVAYQRALKKERKRIQKHRALPGLLAHTRHRRRLQHRQLRSQDPEERMDEFIQHVRDSISAIRVKWGSKSLMFDERSTKKLERKEKRRQTMSNAGKPSGSLEGDLKSAQQFVEEMLVKDFGVLASEPVTENTPGDSSRPLMESTVTDDPKNISNRSN